MNTIERLEELAEKATARPWRASPDGDILSDEPATNEDEEAIYERYGGCPVAETVTPSNLLFIIAAVNALPDLLKLARAVKAAGVQRDPRHRVSMLANDWSAISAALELLFCDEEAQS